MITLLLTTMLAAPPAPPTPLAPPARTLYTPVLDPLSSFDPLKNIKP